MLFPYDIWTKSFSSHNRANARSLSIGAFNIRINSSDIAKFYKQSIQTTSNIEKSVLASDSSENGVFILVFVAEMPCVVAYADWASATTHALFRMRGCARPIGIRRAATEAH